MHSLPLPEKVERIFDSSKLLCDPNKRYFYHERGDGIGSQVYDMYRVKTFCYYEPSNCVYVHKRFTMIDHNYRADPNFLQTADAFFNLAYDSPIIDEIPRECEVKSKFVYPFNVQKYMTSGNRARLRKAYDRGLNLGNYLDQNIKGENIVIYLRRGDRGAPDGRARLTNVEAIRILDVLLAKDDKQSVVTLISQGHWANGTPDTKRLRTREERLAKWKDADKNDLAEPAEKSFEDILEAHPQVRLCLDQDVWKVFHTMVKADILVIDASMFPISAAVLNENRVIANALDKGRSREGYDHYIQPHWEMLEEI